MRHVGPKEQSPPPIKPQPRTYLGKGCQQSNQANLCHGTRPTSLGRPWPDEETTRAPTTVTANISTGTIASTHVSVYVSNFWYSQ